MSLRYTVAQVETAILSAREESDKLHGRTSSEVDEEGRAVSAGLVSKSVLEISLNSITIIHCGSIRDGFKL